MKHKTILKSHGVVRKIGEKFGILECTTKNGRAHGLKLEFSANTIAVELWKDGKLLAFFIFDNNFKELEHKGKTRESHDSVYWLNTVRKFQQVQMRNN